jgi:hypothetical protein
MTDYQDYDEFPELEILDHVFDSLKANTHLQTRTIEGVEKTTSFFDYITLGDVSQLEGGYTTPVICVFISQVQIESGFRSQEDTIKPVVMIDSAVSASTRREAMKQSKMFASNIAKAIKNVRIDGNITVKVTGQLTLNPKKNNELEEVVIRSILETSNK